MALSLFYNTLLIAVGIYLIVTGSLGVNLHNRCNGSNGFNGDSTTQGELIYFIITIIVGIVLILIPLFIFVWHESRPKKS